MHSIPRRLAILVLSIGLALGVPLGIVLGGHTFGDVPDTNIFHDDIDAIADAGVTTGCGGGNFCPDAFVTRQQMAAFMNRLGALGPGKTPVVNAATSGEADHAATADEADHAATAEVAATAAEADTLDGFDSSAFVLEGGPIAVSSSFGWEKGSPADPVNITNSISRSAVRRTSGTGELLFFLHPTVPQRLFGSALQLTSILFCYNATSAGVSLSEFEGWTLSKNGTGGAKFLEDATDRDDETCRTFALSTPRDLSERAGVVLIATVDFTSLIDIFEFGGTTFMLEPIP